MNLKTVGMLVREDACLGCQACQVACREENGFDYTERWMELVRRTPQKVDGELRRYHLISPQMDKCSLCYKKDHLPLCVDICPTKCLYVDTADKLFKVMEGKGYWNLHIF